MAAGTPAIAALEATGYPFTVHQYEVRPADTDSYGEAVAAELGHPGERVFKTLVTMVDGSPTVAIVPVVSQVSLKALARVRGGKRAEMADAATAERLTGYVTGGISPFGQRRRLPTVVHLSALGHETIFVSGGRRGLQLEVAPGTLLELTGAQVAPVAT